MGTTDSKLVKGDPRFDYSEDDVKPNRGFEPSDNKGQYTEEEEKAHIRTQTSNESEESKYGKFSTPSKYHNKRSQVYAEMTKRVLKDKEKFSSHKKMSAGSLINRRGKNVDTDGIEWVKKEEIIDSRLISTKPYGTKAMKDKFSHKRHPKNGGFKARSGVTIHLPPRALATILSYDMGSYRKYMSVCAAWHVTIKEAFDQYFNRVENEFVLKYYQNLLFTQSFTSSSEIRFCGKRGIRVDRVMVCDILKFKPQLNNTLTIGYSFKYYGEPHKRFNAEYRIDVCKNK